MKFKEIEEEEVSQISIGQQLELISKMKEIEYQNALVMKSLEMYNAKYEELKKEHNKLLENTSKKIDQLENSNQMLTKELNQVLQKTQERLENGFDRFEGNVNSVLKENIGSISRDTKEYMQDLERVKIDSKRRFESFYNRKDLLDKLTMVNLAITPCLFLVLVYMTFIKK